MSWTIETTWSDEDGEEHFGHRSFAAVAYLRPCVTKGKTQNPVFFLKDFWFGLNSFLFQAGRPFLSSMLRPTIVAAEIYPSWIPVETKISVKCGQESEIQYLHVHSGRPFQPVQILSQLLLSGDGGVAIHSRDSSWLSVDILGTIGKVLDAVYEIRFWNGYFFQGFVLAITMCREAFDDFCRYRRDKEINSEKYEQVTPAGTRMWVSLFRLFSKTEMWAIAPCRIKSSKIKVGDLIIVRKVRCSTFHLNVTWQKIRCRINEYQLTWSFFELLRRPAPASFVRISWMEKQIGNCV